MLVFLSSFLQGSLVIVYTCAQVPQWTLIIKKQSSENISLQSWGIWLAASLVTLFYACIQYIYCNACVALVFSALASVVCNLITLALILTYRQRMIRADEHGFDLGI